MSTETAATPYPNVAKSPNFPSLERQVIKRWNTERTFLASVDQRDADIGSPRRSLGVGGQIGARQNPDPGFLPELESRGLAAEDFVLAARAAGLGRGAVLRTHLLPGISAVFTVQISLSMGLAILAEAGLSYLGFGAPVGVPSWGRMLAETQAYIAVHPIVVLWPGLAITLTVLAFYLLGDALRDALDPTLRSRGGDA